MEQNLNELMLEWARGEQRFLTLCFFFFAVMSFALAYWQVRKEMANPAKTLPVGAFFVGVVSAIWLGVWIGSALLYAWSDNPEPPMCTIAFTPRWIFIFAPLALLGLNRKIIRTANDLVHRVECVLNRLFEPDPH